MTKMDLKDLKPFKYNGARSMVIMHELHLKSFLNTWKEAKKINLPLPKTDNPDYKSLETLLYHVFRAARGYMTWMCEKLNLPDPEIKPIPKSDVIEKEADEYIAHLLEKWRIPLAEVPIDKFEHGTYTSRWGTDYCIDAMLEHAVMHPIRHEFQLKNLMGME
jgi:predicted nucleotidyltransferase